MMDTKVDWDQLVHALRDELQEMGGLIRLLNQQTEALYRRDIMENERWKNKFASSYALSQGVLRGGNSRSGRLRRSFI